MAIGRNDLCPCGSGKKYKKCCMKKDNVIELNQVREERYFQKREQLIDRIYQFLYKKISLKNRTLLETELTKRLEGQIAPEYLQGIFPYWLTFFYTFENGLRGIEWFIQDVEKFLVTEEDIQIASTWSKLVPRLIKTIDKKEEGILVEDIRTSESFILTNNELMPDAPPFSGSLCILEEHAGQYLYNGIMFWSGPEQVVHADNMIHSLMETNHQAYEQVVFNYYPEILSQLLKHHMPKEDMLPKKLDETTLLYQLHDKVKVVNYFVGNTEYVFDEWKEGDGKLSLTGNWQCYVDEYMQGPIYLGEVYGGVQIKKDKLLYNSLFPEKVADFKKVMENLGGEACELLGEESETLEIPVNAEVRNICIWSNFEVTPIQGSIAQQRWFLSELDKPIPMYDDHSLRELVKIGRADDADIWLREQEYNSYLQLREQFNDVSLTGDFNSIRRELGLEVSPFSIDRKTAIEPCESPINRKPKFSNEEIEMLQYIGFPLEMANEFYARDVVDFFKEKAVGKSNSTVQKYRNGLLIISEYLQKNGTDLWKNADWSQLLQYFEETYHPSMTHTKNVMSTLKAFAKWIDVKYKTNSSETIKQSIAMR